MSETSQTTSPIYIENEIRAALGQIGQNDRAARMILKGLLNDMKADITRAEADAEK